MTKRLFTLITASFFILKIGLAQPFTKSVLSPNAQIQANLMLNEKGEISYNVRYQGKEIVGNSQLGLRLQGHDLSTGMSMIGHGADHKKSSWKPVWGEVAEIEEAYNGIKFELKAATGQRMNLVFRAFDDGVAFRYELIGQRKAEQVALLEEISAFQMTGDHNTWWAPSDWDSNEHTYTNSRISEIDASKYLLDVEPFVQHIVNVKAVQTPVTMQSAAGVCLSIAEAALLDYGALHLDLDSASLKFQAHVIPSDNPRVISINALPFNTPWRAILISPDAAGLLSNRLILNLNEPCKLEGDLSWIKPQKYVGIWWEMHNGKSGWNYHEKDGSISTRHGANTANAKRYIDFAAKNGFSGVLIEGWNEGWDDWYNVSRAEIFDFSKPYPDYDLPELSRYAREKGVKIIVHQETASAIPSFERQIKASFENIRAHGFDAIKTGYVGFIQPKGQWHDSQYMINHYNKVLETAARHQIMVCAHEPVRPSGQHRTWPNYMASEAARGMEFNAWSKGNDPSHELTLIFTRLLGGPIDYTPGIFQLEVNQFDTTKTERVRTTVAKQLALYVNLYSPLQMAADLPENYEKRPDVFQFIRDVPTDWSDTKILNAAVGDYVTIARKKKGSHEWYLGSMTDETPRTFKIKLDFLDEKRVYEAIVYEDGPKAHYLDNPYPVRIRKIKVRKGQTLKIKLAASGGTAISIK
jgi:glucan 1,4-alpha-glucosidase